MPSLLLCRSTAAILSTLQASGLSPFPASCTLPLWVYILPFHKLATILRTNYPINVGIGIVTLYFQRNWDMVDSGNGLGLSEFSVPYISISVSLNVLLTLMIVIRLALHGRNIRTAPRSLAGISELYKAASTMFIESCALFSMNSLLVVGALVSGRNSIRGSYVVDIFFPILAEIQVCTFPQQQSLGQLSNATMDRTGDCSATHHPTGRQRECVDGSHCHHSTHRFVQCQGARGTDG